MRTRTRWTTLVLLAAAVACGDQPTEVVPDRERAPSGVAPIGTMALATASTEDGLTITTDKDDYQPGDTVHLTGLGWPGDDTLDILLEDDPATHDPLRWTVLTDADGAFHDSTYVVDEGDIDVTFTLTATSRTSGRSLAVTFTDGNLQNVSLSPASQTTTPTGSASYTINVTMVGNTGTCTVTLSVLPSPALPAGASASIPSNVVNATNVDFSRTLTITTTAVTPGSYPFTVQAARGADCQGSGNVTVGGTLVVLGPAAKLAFLQPPTNEDAVTAIAPAVTVRVLDAGNNPVSSSAPITVAIGTNPGGGTLSGTLTQNAVSGVATFADLSIDKIGTGYTLTASSPGLTGATSVAFNILRGPAAKLGFTAQPSGGTPNGVFPGQPVVAVQDAGGNTITSGAGSNSNITLAIESGTGTAGAVLACTSNTVNANSGVSAFAGCKINLAGIGYQLRATSGTLTAGVTEMFDVTASNQAPNVDAGGPYTVGEGTALTLAPDVSDPDADPLTYKWTITTTGIDAGGQCTFDDDTAKNATITCTDDSQGAPAGKFTLSLEASDGVAAAVTDVAELTVTNVAPVASGGGPYAGDEGSAVQLNGSADDPGDNDDPNLTYQWSVNTTGIDAGGQCTFDDATKKNAKVTCTDDGSFTLTLTSSDDDAGTSTGSNATLEIHNLAPVAAAGGPYGGDEGADIQLNGSANDAGDNDDPHLTYQWTVNTSGIDAGGQCTFDDATKKNAKVSCTDDGTFTLTLVAKDDDTGTSTGSEANLEILNAGPVASAGGDYSGDEGEQIQLQGSVTDAGANDTHLWTWKYVAGSNVDPGATCSFFPNAAAEDPKISCTDDGTVELTLTVKDDDGAENSDVAMLELTNVAPTAGAGGPYAESEGAGVTLTGTRSDPGANDTHTYLWTVVPGGDVDDGATCSFTPGPTALSPSVSCTDDGTYQLTLRVTDDDTGQDTDGATLTLQNADPVASAGGPYAGAEGQVIQLNGSVTDAGANDTHVWAWDYVSGPDDGGSCTISAPTDEDPTIKCTDDGIVKLTLTVTDDDGGSDTDEATLTLTNANPVVSAGTSYSGSEGGAVGLTGSFTDAGTNDTHTRVWSYTAGAGVDPGASCSFSPDAAALSPSVTCTDDGTYQLTLTVTDDDGGQGSGTASLTLSNVAPVVATLTKTDGTDLPTTIIVAGTLNFRAPFGDAGSNDTHTAALECESGAGFTALGTVATPSFDTGCTFATVGPKTISVRVTDDDGDSHVKTHTLTVKYNFDGFYAPVDRPNTLNLSKAGQAIPLKWRLTDATGAPVTNLAAVTVQAVNLGCNLGDTADNIEEYAAGASGLQNLGNGNYQFNWKTPAGYAGSCKSIKLVFGAGALSYTEGPLAYFSFKK